MTESAAMPLLSNKVVIDDYASCQEILVAQKAFEVGAFEPYSAPIWGRSLPISNDPTHLRRRRYMASLLSRSAMARYDREFLTAAIEDFIAQGRASPDGEVDLIALVRLMLVRVTATIIGIDGVQDDEARARRLMACVDGFISATQVRYSTRDPEEVIPEALEAVRIYREELFDPSVARRQALIDAGDEVPDDLIARQLQPDAQDLWDEDTAWRDTLTIFAGGLQTTAVAVAQSVDEFFAWPEHDLQMLEDPDMVRAVVNETLRLKPPVPYILRRAKADITLRSGREIAAGQELALDVTAANRETAVFGADADVFRPGRFRELPPRYPQYGLAFGAGSHVCYGKPLATVGGVDRRESDVPRVVTKVFDALVSAGVRPAPDHAPDKEASYRDIFRTYPVVFPVASRA